MGHNKFSSWTEAEMNVMMGRRPDPASLLAQSTSKASQRPRPNKKSESSGDDGQDDGGSSEFGIDWRKKGAVNEPIDQGSCGSCYSFGVCASMEGLYATKGKGLMKLAEQVLVSCDKK